MPMHDSKIAVLGAGITGLTAAYTLSKQNVDVTVYEQSDEVGGAIKTTKKNGWLVEKGPNTLMVKDEEIWNLLNELGLDDQIVKASETAKKRFIVKNDSPTALPGSFTQFLTTSLFSASAKFRLLKEPFVAASNQQDESIASYIERRLGPEPLNYGVNPFVSGIFAGDPKRLSMKHTFSSLWKMEQNYGSLLKGMMNREKSDDKPESALLSFVDGNQTLPKTLTNSLSNAVKTSSTITSVESSNENWTIKGKANGKTFADSFDAVISTLPAYSLAQVFQDSAADELSDISYAPMSVLALGFTDDQVGHPLDGFGMLVPEVEQYNLLGALFSSSLFNINRAPEGHHLLTCFLGGDRNSAIASEPTDKLQEMAMTELSGLLDISGSPVFSYHKYWKRAIPQYHVGYDSFLSVINEIEEDYAGLKLAGNFRGGVSVPDCIKSGIETAGQMEEFL